MSDIRVRIAPSPSGFLHIGTAKMALFNWLYARNMGGTMVLRLEDTDAERTEEEFVQAMCEGFHWLGIDWDEGPPFGDVPEKGAYGPYRQSQRQDLYRQEVDRLLAERKAYRCFCTVAELDAERERARAEKRGPGCAGACRNLRPEEVAAKGDARSVVRFVVAPGKTVVHDLIQGDVTVNNTEIGDFVIQKPNGDAIFHLAVVVDDGHMKITHVIRGDDHLTNCARHVMLFGALGYPVPQFAHLPMVLDEHGKKYSKRLHGANVLDWRADGFLPEALINYVALLGWTPKDEEEVLSREDLIQKFTMDRLGKSAAKFDLKKLQWLNGQHIRMLGVEDLRDRCVKILAREGFDVASRDAAWLTRMAEVCQDKLKTLNEIVSQTDFFFKDITEYEEKAVNKQWRNADSLPRLEAIRVAFSSVVTWDLASIKAAIEGLAEASGEGLGTFIHPTRLALSGKSVGPGLFELAELLGKDMAMARLDAAVAYVRKIGESGE